MNCKNLEKVKVIFLGIIATVLLFLLVIVSLKFKEDSKYKKDVQNNDRNSEVTETKSKKDDTLKKEEDISLKKDSDVIKNQDDSVSNSQVNKNNVKDDIDTNTNHKDREEVVYSPNDVVSYFDELNKNIDTYKSSNDVTMKEKIKSGFITVVDFLFYDGVIKGYTFDELTSNAKIKVLTLALKIDNKIDKYFPNYKESIKNKVSAFKEKTALLYLETTAKLCENIGEESCDLARENFKDMKESFGFTWAGIKKVATTSASKLTILLEEWYQSIKN